jgi:hypothetical protein
VVLTTRQGGMILRHEEGASPRSYVSIPTDIRRVDECLERLKRFLKGEDCDRSLSIRVLRMVFTMQSQFASEDEERKE